MRLRSEKLLVSSLCFQMGKLVPLQRGGANGQDHGEAGEGEGVGPGRVQRGDVLPVARRGLYKPLTSPDPQLKGAWCPGGFNPHAYQAKTRFQRLLSNGWVNLYRYSAARSRTRMVGACTAAQLHPVDPWLESARFQPSSLLVSNVSSIWFQKFAFKC
jgi:hypothetical protein